jgi:hypothetical protein
MFILKILLNKEGLLVSCMENMLTQLRREENSVLIRYSNMSLNCKERLHIKLNLQRQFLIKINLTNHRTL